MCAVWLAIVCPTQLPLSGWVESSRHALSHRGPDDSGVFENKQQGTCLIHTRLSILDLSALGHQPMLTDDGRVALVFNGELYNFSELRVELENEGYAFHGSSDTEVLLALYMSIRDKCDYRPSPDVISLMLQRLNGIFAFALWDEDFEGLLLARDALGVKPLYVEQTLNGLYFASESKALPNSSLTLNCASLDRYLTFLWNPGDSTPVTQVRKVCPGDALWIARGEIREHFTWYRLPYLVNLIALLLIVPSLRRSRYKISSPSRSPPISCGHCWCLPLRRSRFSSVVAFARELNLIFVVSLLRQVALEIGVSENLLRSSCSSPFRSAARRGSSRCQLHGSWTGGDGCIG